MRVTEGFYLGPGSLQNVCHWKGVFSFLCNDRSNFAYETAIVILPRMFQKIHVFHNHSAFSPINAQVHIFLL